MIKLQGKYEGRSRYYLVRAQRAALRSVIRPLVNWRPMNAPADGYTVILGCTHRLSHMLCSNLRLLSQQDVTDLHNVIVVVDRCEAAMPNDFERDLRRQYPQLPLRVLFYSPRQEKVTRMVGWAWVYSWLSWCIGIAATRTRYALLHDFDAMLLRDDVLRSRYRSIVQRPIEYLGVRYYGCNGVLESDQLVTTFEMMFDAAFVRHHFQPIDVFNHVCTWRGRTVDFDTFLYAQSQHGSTALLPLDAEDMVHPSQMICQFTELMNNRELNPTRSSLLMIPYFLSVGREDDPMMMQIHRQLSANGTTVEFYGKQLDVAKLSHTHVQWLAMQAERLDTRVFGEVRQDVRRYFDSIAVRAAGAPGKVVEHAQ